MSEDRPDGAPAESWLSLLLRDAPPTELDALRRSLLATAGADRAAVEDEARRALQLHALLRDRAQRAAELAVLSDVAARLTSVRDVTDLLSDIAAQARQLLRTDVAYLALLTDGALRIRYFDGVMGPAVREVTLSLTTGLAGKVMTTGRAFWTEDYLADPSIEHHPDADALAGDERLRSILGVPLRSHGEVLGVLFAAERSRRPFSDGEVALLTGLASHAAVALDNAALFEAEHRAVAELTAANAALQSGASAVDRAVALHERLTDAAVRGGGPTEVVRALADVLGVAVQLVDAHDRPLAGPDLDAPPLAEHFGAAGAAALGTEVRPGDGDEVLVLCPVVAADAYLGCLVVRGRGGADEAEVRLLERGALGIALALVQQRALAEASARSQGELLTALVEGGDPGELTQRAAAARVDLTQPHRLVLLQSLPGHEAAARGGAAELSRRHGGLVVERAGRQLLLVPERADVTLLADHATGGASEPVTGAAALPAALGEARSVLQALLALDRLGVVAQPADLGVYRFLLAGSGAGEAHEFMRRTLGPLLEHDEQRGTELCGTVEAYLASGRQHTATAERLHIHPNTLYQRLARVAVVLGEHWRDPDNALDLHLALRLHRMAGVLDPPRET